MTSIGQTFEATVRLRDRLRLVVALIHLEEQPTAFLLRELRHLLTRDAVVIHRHVVVDTRELGLARYLPDVVGGARASQRHDLVVFGHVHRGSDRVQEPRDLLGRGPPVGNRRDDRRWPLAVVTGHEDLRDRSLVGLRIDLEIAVTLDAELWDVGEPGRVGVLAQREQYGLAGDVELGARDRLRAAASALVRLAKLVADEAHAARVSPLRREDLDRRREIHEVDALTLGLGELFLVDDHLIATAAVDDRDVIGAEPPGGRCTVHRGVAATQHHDVLPHLDRAAAIGALEEHDPRHHTIGIEVLDLRRIVRLEATGGHEHGVVLVVQLPQPHIATDVGRKAQLNVLVDDPVDVAVDDLARQTERRHARERGAPRLIERVEHGNAEAELREVARGRETRASGADDRDAPARRADDRRRRLRVAVPIDAHIRVSPVRQELLHVADRERLVDLFAPARGLARRGAHGAADRGHWVRIESELPRLLVLAGRREVEIPAAVRLHGTGFLTRDVVLVPGRPDLHHLVQLSHA